jgi:hypothetical protein
MAFRKIDFSKADRPDRVSPGAAAIRRIAKRFQWSMFSPVFVAPVEGGFYAIIDGQHRTHAAAICGFSQVPCQIVQMTTEQQAAAFAAVNGVVTKVTPVQLLKAALAAGEEWATTAAAIAEEGGARLMTTNKVPASRKAGEIYGVKGFLKVISSRPREAVVASLRMMMASDGYNDNQDIWDGFHLVPLLMAMAERPVALANPGFRRALEDFDYWETAERDHQARRAATRAGNPYPPRPESMRAEIVSWIDKTFPARMALPCSKERAA